ncbi:MAG: tRNA uridine(34) 5-carboxymethylaminomethyl modification radical SAM/GNAT enzyme Elp3 [Myxococcales bacterium]|nr:tRNA uridine(34) 5-carboxymethylaminomethyl modification radical SAM/GNAT enzyme Elp3 [Myxococcales bacterium]
MVAPTETARGRRLGPDRHFEPERHREVLLPLLCALEAEILAAERAQPEDAHRPLPPERVHALLRRFPKDGRGFFSRSELLSGHRHFGPGAGLVVDSERLAQRLRMRPVRTQSGVTPVTVLTKPYPCPGTCIFCPNDVKMPKSYLSREPGCQRAEQNRFDPYLQTYNRLEALRAIGHPTDKVELIVLGGTFSFYPRAYQRHFVKRCFDALNDFGRGRDGRAEAERQAAHVEYAADGEASAAVGESARYNLSVRRVLEREHGPSLLSSGESASAEELFAVQRLNEAAPCRNVGLVVETRPDRIDGAELLELRSLGCTKIQIGYQSLDDRILALNGRGHDLSAIRRATALLRRAGFKIHAHLMPNLLGADPEHDLADIARLFDDPDFRPDELKVYPCSLIDGTVLMEQYRAGRYQPYDYPQLLRVLEAALERTPRYCRLTRVVRDISAGDIVAGNRRSNFRELAERSLRARGASPVDIRAREIGSRSFDPETVRLRSTAYATSSGREFFIELESAEGWLLGFVRLSLPAAPSFIEELGDSAIIRELHVYGAALELGSRRKGPAQHLGFGTRLLDEAAECARQAGFEHLAVISAVGTRAYYRSRGFTDGEFYQHRKLSPPA